MFRASEQYEKSQEYLVKGLKIARIYNDTTDLSFLLNNLGIVTKNLGDLEKSIEYYNEGLSIAKLTGNLRREGDLVFNLANVEFKLGNKEKGFQLLERSTQIAKLIGGERDLALEYYNIGYWHGEFKDYNQAIQYSLKAMALAEETEYLDVLEASSEVLANTYAEKGDYRNAFKYKELTDFYADSIKQMSDKNALLEVENQFELEKIAYKDSLDEEKRALGIEHKQKLTQQKVKARENLLWTAAGVLVIILLTLIQLFRTNKKVKVKNEVITKQKDEIEDQHKEITDSINYAQKIQSALIAGNEEWNKISAEHFILFKPKDVVSGDFYWAYHSDEDNKAIWVTADCTGHGVPGAFMSMLGIGFLNEIIVENGNRNGSEILNQLRSKIINALQQKGSEKQQKDGMDLALCIWDKTNNTLEFTGANNNLYLIRKSEKLDLEKFDKQLSHPSNGLSLIELKANKMPVGFQSDIHENFKSEIIQLNKGDYLVTFTDGYADQFGGEKGKKLKYKPFKEMLLENHDKPMRSQSNILDEAFQNWRGDLEQVDDVCVIGVRI